jgi:hypothetical protein
MQLQRHQKIVILCNNMTKIVKYSVKKGKFFVLFVKCYSIRKKLKCFNLQVYGIPLLGVRYRRLEVLLLSLFLNKTGPLI